jgi:hypothetical protein
MQGAQKLRSEEYLQLRRNNEFEAQRRRWTFYETIIFGKNNIAHFECISKRKGFLSARRAILILLHGLIAGQESPTEFLELCNEIEEEVMKFICKRWERRTFWRKHWNREEIHHICGMCRGNDVGIFFQKRNKVEIPMTLDG